MIKFKFTNSFHKTNCTVFLPRKWTLEGQGQAFQEIQNAALGNFIPEREAKKWKRIERKLRRVLCCSDCKCGVVR